MSENRISLPMVQSELSRMNPFYQPTRNTLEILNKFDWLAAFSGGKDSTSVVTWIEYLRRVGMVKVDRPRAVQSDTEAEYPFLQEVTELMISRLRACGWEVTIVRPPTHRKLYNSIFGVGQTPVNPSFKGGRWCTHQTKITPMTEFKKTLEGKMIFLTGVRWGESAMRDERLKRNEKKLEGDKRAKVAGCNAGGECGLPQITKKSQDDTFAPIITWKDSDVLCWLSGSGGQVDRTVPVIGDLRDVSQKLLHVYKARLGDNGLGIFPRKTHFMRFGCAGCPALRYDKVIKAMRKESDQISALGTLYEIWDEARKKYNRVRRFDEKKQKWTMGPLKIEARKKLFAKFLDVQRRAGMVLVDDEDIAFIHECWEKKVYPGKDPNRWKE